MGGNKTRTFSKKLNFVGKTKWFVMFCDQIHPCHSLIPLHPLKKGQLIVPGLRKIPWNVIPKRNLHWTQKLRKHKILVKIRNFPSVWDRDVQIVNLIVINILKLVNDDNRCFSLYKSRIFSNRKYIAPPPNIMILRYQWHKFRIFRLLSSSFI